ncbi:1675_t:CDS:2, partial [Funneliformis mosseae]
MGHTLARVTVFFVSVSFLLYSLFVATVTFLKLNFTVYHVSEPLRIGYGVILVILAPSGLWGIIGSTQNNSDLCDRYLREHWFSSGVFTIIDGIKVALSFTMKIDSINACVTPTDSSQDAIDGCRSKVDFNQIASLIIFGAQEFFLIFLGILVWYSCKRIKRITKKINEKGKEEALERLDLSEVIPDESNVASMNAYDLREQRQNLPLDRINVQPTSTHVPRRPSQYNKGRNDRQTIQIKPEPMPNVLRSREFQGDNYDDNNNVQGMRRYDQRITAPPRPRKSYNRQNTTSIELQRELSASQSMNSMATTGRSKSMRMAAPFARSNNNVLPPQFQPMQQIKYPQGARNKGVNDGPDPPEGTPFRTHRRSRSHPQLRPLPDPPTSDNFTVQPDHS